MTKMQEEIVKATGGEEMPKEPDLAGLRELILGLSSQLKPSDPNCEAFLTIPSRQRPHPLPSVLQRRQEHSGAQGRDPRQRHHHSRCDGVLRQLREPEEIHVSMEYIDIDRM